MAGELWRGLTQVGLEGTGGTNYGVPAAATRQLLMDTTGTLSRTRAAHVIKVSTGTPDNVRGIKNRAVAAGGSFKQTLDADEIIEPLLACVQGGVTPVTALGASTWTLKPSQTLDSQTWEQFDGYNGWQESGVYVDTLKLTWSSAAAGDVMMDYTLFGKDRVQHTITPSLTTRSPIWIEGWETQVFLDAMGGTPGTTAFGTAISGTLTISRKLGRKYFAANTQATGAVTEGEYDCTGDIIIEGNTASLTEYADWDTSVPRLLSLKFGGNGAVIGTSALKRSVSFNVPCFYTAYDLSGSDAGTRVAKATWSYSYDPTNAFSTQIVVVNSRSAAYV